MLTEYRNKFKNGVSTHSRPKAAGAITLFRFPCCLSFQHTAARRRLAILLLMLSILKTVSTHSRPKAAGDCADCNRAGSGVSTHSRPKAAGAKAVILSSFRSVSTHSRPKAAGVHPLTDLPTTHVSTHSRPKAAGVQHHPARWPHRLFQHTAARRRLGFKNSVLL